MYSKIHTWDTVNNDYLSVIFHNFIEKGQVKDYLAIKIISVISVIVIIFKLGIEMMHSGPFNKDSDN